MNPIFADTSFLVAYLNEEDEHHRDAREFLQERLHEYQPSEFVITDYVFDETVTVLLDGGKALATEAAIRLLDDPTIQMAFVTEELFRDAVEIFISYADKAWSFTDCTSYVWIRSRGITFSVAFDEHFDQFGICTNLVSTP